MSAVVKITIPTKTEFCLQSCLREKSSTRCLQTLADRKSNKTKPNWDMIMKDNFFTPLKKCKFKSLLETRNH